MVEAPVEMEDDAEFFSRLPMVYCVGAQGQE